MKWLIKEEHGGTLALTLIVMLVLSILGFSLLSVSVAEAKFAANQLNSTQAYFVARSGAEVALKNIETTIKTGNYQSVTTLYSALTKTLTGSVNTGEDTYTVNYIDGGLVAQGKIKIYSIGTTNGSTATTAVTVEFNSPTIPNGWVNKGGIIMSGTRQNTDAPVVVNVYKFLGHGTKKSSEKLTTWKAPSIHFVDNDGGVSLEISAKTLKVQTNLMSFKHRIFMKSDETGSLIYETFNAAGFRGPNNSVLDGIPEGWGVVRLTDVMYKVDKSTNVTLWAAGFYAVKSGTDLTDTLQRNDTNLVKEITSQATKDYITSIINKETGLFYNPEKKTWSKE